MDSAYDGALEAIDRILNRGGDADEVLRAVLAVLRERAGFEWAAIAFAEAAALLLGPEAGERGGEEAVYPVAFRGTCVAELRIAPASPGSEAFLQRVALLIGPQCLVGWDTGGEVWNP